MTTAAPRRIALVGLPGSGKSTVARLLAERLGVDALDMDGLVEGASGRSVQAVFDEEGEESFRSLEMLALDQALRRDRPCVISTGGGLMTQEEARRLLLDSACVVWLDAGDDVLLARLEGGPPRPLLAGDPAGRLAELRARRAPAYSSAHLRLATDGLSPGAVADRLHGLLAGAVRIAVPGRAHHVVVAPGATADLAVHLPPAASRVAIVTDSAVAPLAESMRTDLTRAGLQAFVLTLEGGERIKTWARAGELLAELAGLGLERRDCLVAVGGGTVGDLAGFAAAAYLRGIAWVNVPTTLLAMVDSAIGGKTGVNLPGGKNLAGAVWQPRAVLCDPELVRELPDRPFRAAFAEIVKYSMIVEDGGLARLDGGLDALLARDLDALAATVRDCCAVKGAVVAADEREAGPRAVLNYGHTAGHALEAATGYGDALWHGEAIATGMRIAGLLSVRHLGCPETDIAWQNELLERCGLGVAPAVDPDRVLALLPADKKASGGRPRWVLLTRRGAPRLGQDVPDDVVRRTVADVLGPAAGRGDG